MAVPSPRELVVGYAVAAAGFLLASLPASLGKQAAPRALDAGGEASWYEANPSSGRSIPEQIRRVAVEEGVDPALVAAIVQVESGFDPKALSPRGAVGLMQVLPETASLVGVVGHEEPTSNLQAGCRYLHVLFEEFGGDVELVLAAYNAGPGAVYRSGGIPPYGETRAFVARVAETYRNLTGQPLAAAKLGFWAPEGAPAFPRL
ncbi:MAG: lytic transglycosylase domain-containing protein [Thermoanaerobaculum sp.]